MQFRSWSAKATAGAAAALLACVGAVPMAHAGTPRFTPAGHDFGTVPIGGSATINISLDLAAGADSLRSLGIDAAPTLADTTTFGDFTLNHGNCVRSWIGTGTPLAPGVGCTFSLTYTPTSVGPAAAMVTATDWLDGHWGMMSLAATGAAAPAPAAIPALSPWSILTLTGLLGVAGLVAHRRRS